MKLPAHPEGGVQIGISDILAWRDCAARMAEGMKRHSIGDPPESWSPENAYGSAIHDCLSMLDDGATPDEAVHAVFPRFKQWLEPSDVQRLRDDMEKYLAREMTGVRTLLNESEISIPLFVHPTAGQVWFRARIDRLYQALDDPSLLIHIDYKSGKWAKSAEEVAKDLQLWSYNLGIYEWFTDLYPEHENVRIQQVYDQLVYGEMPVPPKGAEQRAGIRDWLITAITAIIEDEDEAPTFNEWCPWCHLKMDCPVVQYELTDWALTKIAALMPREQKLKKDGTPSKRQGKVQLDRERLGEYVELLPDIHRAEQVLDRFNDEVRSVLKRLPDQELEALGKRKYERSRRAFPTEAKRRIVEEIGLGRALMLFDLSLAGVERFFGDDKETRERIESYAERQGGYTVIDDL